MKKTTSGLGSATRTFNRIFKSILIATAMFMTAAVFTACSKDDDEQYLESSITTSSVEGCWECKITIPGMPEPGIFRFTFNKNGTFEFYTKTFETEYDHLTGTYTIVDVIEERQTGKWSLSGDIITIEGFDNDGLPFKGKMKVEFRGNQLLIYMGQNIDGAPDAIPFDRV